MRWRQAGDGPGKGGFNGCPSPYHGEWLRLL